MLASILVCPLCHAALDGVTCSGCGRVYAVVDGVPNLTPVPPPDRRVQARWDVWERLQANGRRAYEIDPSSSLSVGERSDADAFAEFSQLRGLVLDVGCGVQALPSYARRLDGLLVGVDPLRGESERRFEFVQAIAEYLPFRDRAFDRVLFATSLDHVLVPELALVEAHRVTKVRGSVCLWLGEVPGIGFLERVKRRIRPPRTARILTPQAEMVFPIPEGAIDAFHVDHPDAHTVIDWLRQAGLTVDVVTRPLSGHCFIRAVRRR